VADLPVGDITRAGGKRPDRADDPGPVISQPSATSYFPSRFRAPPSAHCPARFYHGFRRYRKIAASSFICGQTRGCHHDRTWRRYLLAIRSGLSSDPSSLVHPRRANFHQSFLPPAVPSDRQWLTSNGQRANSGRDSAAVHSQGVWVHLAKPVHAEGSAQLHPLPELYSKPSTTSIPPPNASVPSPR
jgi:hypothetical protein